MRLDLGGTIVNLKGMTVLLLVLHIAEYQSMEWWALLSQVY